MSNDIVLVSLVANADSETELNEFLEYATIDDLDDLDFINIHEVAGSPAALLSTWYNLPFYMYDLWKNEVSMSEGTEREEQLDKINMFIFKFTIATSTFFNRTSSPSLLNDACNYIFDDYLDKTVLHRVGSIMQYTTKVVANVFVETKHELTSLMVYNIHRPAANKIIKMSETEILNYINDVRRTDTLCRFAGVITSQEQKLLIQFMS